MATSIPASQARAQFTQACIDVFTDAIEPTSFLRSFFPNDQSFTRYVSIQVMRNYELVATDVLRGTQGNRNNFAKSTEKVFDPAYMREFFDMTEIDLYDRLFGSSAIDSGIFSQLTQEVARRLSGMRNKIERAYEKWCAEALTLGTVTMVNATSVDFGRNARALIANGAGITWATGTVDPFANIGAWCDILRGYGKVVGQTFNLINGATAHNDLFNNTIFKTRVTQNLNNSIDSLVPAQKNSVGGVFHGTLTCGSYRVNLWTYPQSYDVSGTPTSYLNVKKSILLPETPRFKLAFAAVPQLLGGNGGTEPLSGVSPMAAQSMVVGNYTDAINSAHIMDIKSAGMPILTAVDQVVTAQPCA